jgi:hypothetical protein
LVTGGPQVRVCPRAQGCAQRNISLSRPGAKAQSKGPLARYVHCSARCGGSIDRIRTVHLPLVLALRIHVHSALGVDLRCGRQQEHREREDQLLTHNTCSTPSEAGRVLTP